jgi:hypothetical protein
VAQCEVRADHLGEIESHALKEVRLQRHCNTHRTKITSLLAIQLRRLSKSTDQTRAVESRWSRGLTKGLALDLLEGDGAREVEVVHLLLGHLLLTGLLWCVGGGFGSPEGRSGAVGAWRRGRRGRGVAGGGAHGSSGGAGG